METLEHEILARHGVTVEQARTLPASWYADPDHFRVEVDAVFHHEWVGVGVTDDVATPGSFLATTVGGTVPIVVTRDEVGTLRAFHNVCRHRAAPVAEGCGDARLLQCPYHAWIYRLDGTLAKAGGIGTPEGFTTDDLPLHEVRVATFARSVFVNLDPDAPDFDPGPLATGLTPYALDRMELVARDRWERSFNWKVFLENYSENYHTPFVHPELISAGWDYPMETAGPIVFAWDAPHLPRSPGEEALANARPGKPGWERVADAFEDDSFIGGSYLTLWPNTMISVFADFAASLRLEPLGPDRTVVTREYFWHERVSEARRQTDLRATQLVGAQDLDICEAVQRSHSGGTSADGPLSTEHERGVAHVHQLLVAALERSLLRVPR